MNRRQFVSTTVAALTALRLGHAQTAGKKREFKKAVNLGMAKGTGSVSDRFKMIQDAGFDGVELNRPDAQPLEDILKAKQATGLQISNVICSTHWGKPLTHQDPAVREQGLRGLKLSLQEAGELGAPAVLLVPGVVNADVSYADAYPRAQEAIRAALPDAEKAKVKIAVENVWNNFLMSPLESVRFVDEFKSPLVGWHFDIGNVVTTGWPEQWIRILGPRILTLHIKEFSRKKQNDEGLRKGFGVELGEGDVNWAAVMQAVDDIGYKGWGVLEVPGGDLERLKFLAKRTDELYAK